MGKRRVLEYPPPCPTCGEEFTYSKFPYCSCSCGNFVYQGNGIVVPVDKHKSKVKVKRAMSDFVQKWGGSLGVKNWKEYEELNGWEEPGESEE